MGDTTSVVIKIRKSDHEKANEIFGGELRQGSGAWNGNSINDEDDTCIEFFIMEMNYGGYDNQEELVRNGIPFIGSHGLGDNYDGMKFCSDGKELFEHARDSEDFFICRVNDEGKIMESDMENIKQYIAAEKRVNKILYGEISCPTK